MTNAIRTNFFAYSAAPVALASCKCTIEVRIQTVLRKRRLEGSSGSFMYFDHDQLHSYPLRFYMAVSILNFTCNQMFPFDGHLLATSPQQTTKLQMNLTLTSIN
jgi:hypothetical protein